MKNLKLTKTKLVLPYVLMITSSVTYHKNTKDLDGIFYVCLVVSLLALAILVLFNSLLFTRFKSKLVFWDILFVLGLVIIPHFYLPFNLNLFGMAFLGTLYAFYMVDKKWNIQEGR